MAQQLYAEMDGLGVNGIVSNPLFSSDEGGEADKENMQYAVLSSTRQLVEKSEEVLQIIAADRENSQGDIQAVKDSLQSLQAEQKKIAKMLESVAAGGGLNSPQTRKQKVNREVSLQVRGTYKDMVQSTSCDATGWNIRRRFTDPVNRAVTESVVKEVRGQFPHFTEGEVKFSCKRYFRTLCQNEKRKASYVTDLQKQKNRQRCTRKCKERLKALKRMLQSDEERLKKWMNLMVNDFMSSEESCEDDDSTFVVRPLPWRSLKVNDFFGRLDTSSQNHRSSQSRKMRNERHSGVPSERPCPIAKYGKSLLWAFSRAYHPAQSPSTSTPSRSRN